MPQNHGDASLLEKDLQSDPFAQFERWLTDAGRAGLVEPTAMALATASRDGAPSVRMVLFKGVQDGGLTFYTNYSSRKGDELTANPRVALVFWWDRLERQVRAEGTVSQLSREQSQRYFHERPRESQISAAVSHQSRAVANREDLERRYAERERQLQGRPVPLPDDWGGYLVKPALFEFWQGRRGRLHDRLVYRASGGGWKIERLEP